MAKGLTVKRVEALLRAGVPSKHTDGDVKGLMLIVESPTSAAWSLRWQRDHKIRHMGLGSARDLPLASAREKARELRERISRDIDPLEIKRQDTQAKQQAEAKRLTFKEAAERCHAGLEPGWSGERTGDEFISSLRRWVFPIFGNVDVGLVGKSEVLRCLEQKTRAGGIFWTTKSQTADRTRSRIERVLDWGEARDYRTAGTPNPARWKNFLDVLLPKPRKVAPVVPMPSLPYADLPQLMVTLAADESVAAKALMFAILSASRIGEVLGAVWDEISFEEAEWVIPAARMKARREHRVPLTSQMLALLEDLPREEGCNFVFVSPKTAGVPVTDPTVTRTLRLHGCTATTHGFRSTFSTWAAEQTGYAPAIVEAALAHAIKNKVEGAYKRTTFFDKRRRLMEAWATYCCTPVEKKTGKVVALRA
jgi:integrase